MLSQVIPSTDRASRRRRERRSSDAGGHLASGGFVDRFLSHFTHRFDAKGRDLDPGRLPAGAGEGRVRGRLCSSRRSISRRSTAAATGCWRRSTRCWPRCRRSRRRATPSPPRFSERARSCAWTSEGRVMLDERLKASLGLERRGGVRRAGPQVPDLGARRGSLRISRRRGRGFGALRAGDGRARRRRDRGRPATFPCSSPRSWTRSRRDRAPSSSTAPSAPAAIRARCSTAAPRSSRSTAIPRAIAARRGPRRRIRTAG